jgi:hypothetical protein
MQTLIIEAHNGMNYGKFLLATYGPEEWSREARVEPTGRKLLPSIGFGGEWVWVLDLQTREGAAFLLSGQVTLLHQLEKHQVWVCPMYEFFLGWLLDRYREDSAGVMALNLPDVVELDTKYFALAGYRRKGPGR